MTSTLAVNETAIQEFLNAPKVSIAEALGSPHKRNASVEGTVM